MGERTYAVGRDRLREALNGLAEFADRRESPAVTDAALALDKKLVENRFNVVVFGEFKRGKTTFVNALLGADILPSAVVPLTSIVTAVTWGEEIRVRVGYFDGREEDVDVQVSPGVRHRAGQPGQCTGGRAGRGVLPVRGPSRWGVPRRHARGRQRLPAQHGSGARFPLRVRRGRLPHFCGPADLRDGARVPRGSPRGGDAPLLRPEQGRLPVGARPRRVHRVHAGGHRRCRRSGRRPLSDERSTSAHGEARRRRRGAGGFGGPRLRTGLPRVPAGGEGTGDPRLRGGTCSAARGRRAQCAGRARAGARSSRPGAGGGAPAHAGSVRAGSIAPTRHARSPQPGDRGASCRVSNKIWQSCVPRRSTA